MALKDLARTDGIENVYIEIPKINLNKIIVGNSEVHSRFGEWDEWLEEHQILEDIFGSVDKEFLKFKKSAQKEVNYLVKEFGVRKQQILMLALQLRVLVFLTALNFILTNIMKIFSRK